MAKKEEKTNVMRVLDQKKIPHIEYNYETDGAPSGVECANIIGRPCEMVFKTLVTMGTKGRHYVFMVPVAEELDLKKAAKAAGDKNIALVPSRDLLELTGYIHGGCSPIGMKKYFPSFIDSSAEQFETIAFSAGKIGHQVEMKLSDLRTIIKLESAELTKAHED
jgi:Cys-tRNA(Pro)/Cys-tRNA(Cys) deacylase